MTNNIKNRILNVLPAASLEMFELLNLFDIEITKDKVKTAAVTCDIHPILYVNEGFINKYCQSDEHLFMLIMHELYHIILGHTTLFKSSTEIDNIAFDAIINSLLCKLFPEEKYVSFFKAINDESIFPSLLLRPEGDKTPKEYKELLYILYKTETGTYYEIYQKIISYVDKFPIKNGFILLGDHNRSGESTNPILKKALEKIIEKWPREMKVSGRDQGAEISDSQIDKFVRNNKLYLKMKRLLYKAGVSGNKENNNKRAYAPYPITVTSFIPNYKSRTNIAKKALIPNNLLYENEIKDIWLVKEKENITNIYLDVSGSTDKELSKIYPLLCKPYKEGKCKLYLFSTEVYEITYKDLKEGRYKTTGGTDISSVFNHYFLSKKRNKKILIITDGYVGDLTPTIKEKIKKEKVQVYVGLFASYTKEDMKSYVKEFEIF